jgi:hypothetical protein
MKEWKKRFLYLLLTLTALTLFAGLAAADQGGTAAGILTVNDEKGTMVYFRPSGNGAAFLISQTDLSGTQVSPQRGAPDPLTDDPAVARPAALAALDKAYSRYPKADYNDAEWAQIQAAYNGGKSAIQSAATYAQIQSALAAAAETMAGVSASNGSRNIKVAVTVEKFVLGGGYIVEPKLFTVSNHTLASDVIITALKDKYPGVTRPYRYSGNTKKNFYLSGVYDPDYKGSSGHEQSYTGFLSEFDEGSQSGWMYAVNNDFPGVGAAAFSLIDGDVMRWQYTKTGLGADIGADNSAWGSSEGVNTADKDALTWKVAEINADGEKAAYGDTYKNAIAVLSKITSTQTEVDAALAALKKSSGSGTDDEDTEDNTGEQGDTATGSWDDITERSDIPSAVGNKAAAEFSSDAASFAEKGVSIADAGKVMSVTASSNTLPKLVTGLGKNVASFLKASDGAIEADERAVRAAVEASSALRRSVDADKAIASASPVSFTASAKGATVIITIPINFKKLTDDGAAAFKDIVLLKLTDDGSLLSPAKKGKLSDIALEGDYVIKDDGGETVNDATTVSGSKTYYVFMAVKDGGAYDWDDADSRGHIFDPVCAGITATASGGGDGGASGGGGCDSGAPYLFSFLACLAIAAFKRAGSGAR